MRTKCANSLAHLVVSEISVARLCGPCGWGSTLYLNNSLRCNDAGGTETRLEAALGGRHAHEAGRLHTSILLCWSSPTMKSAKRPSARCHRLPPPPSTTEALPTAPTWSSSSTRLPFPPISSKSTHHRTSEAAFRRRPDTRRRWGRSGPTPDRQTGVPSTTQLLCLDCELPTQTLTTHPRDRETVSQLIDRVLVAIS